MTARAQGRLQPTVQRVEPGRDAYVSQQQLRGLVKRGSRWWTFHGAPTTVHLEGNSYAKRIDGFTHHLDNEETFLELLREYGEQGCPRPTGYADVFHAHHRTARVPWSVNAMLAPALAGGWQAALIPGIFRGVYHRYDMRSAYLWAGSLGLPDPATYQAASSISKRLSGVYRVTLTERHPDAPYPFTKAREALATDEEIELYGLKVGRVIAGVTWRRLLDPEPMMEAIRRVSTWKQAGRSYWGRWGQTAQVMCHTRTGKSWAIPNVSANVPAAALIIARVKARVWTAAAAAVHVYIDSVITPRTLRTGPALGDWKLEHTYHDGVIIKAPGWYGPIGQPLEKMAGVPKNSPLRRALRDVWADSNPELLLA